MAEKALGNIRYTQPRPYTPDTSGLTSSLEGLSQLGQQVITNDILGNFGEEAQEAISSVSIETQAADAGVIQSADAALRAAEEGDFLRETQLLRDAVQNAPTAGAKTRAMLKMQEALQKHALRNPKMRDALIQEARSITSASAELTSLGIRDSSVTAAGSKLSQAQERIDQIMSVATKSIDSGGLGITAAFGTPSFARQYTERNKMLQEANTAELKLNMIAAQEGVQAQQLERVWNQASKSQLNVFYTALTDENSPLARMASLRRKVRVDGGSDAELVAQERDFKETQVPLLRMRIEGAINHYRNTFNDNWSTLAGTNAYDKARQRMEDEISGLRQVSTLLESNTEEAWNVLKTTQTQRVATVLDEHPLIRNLATMREALGVDTLDFATKHDPVFGGVETQRLISQGILETINSVIPMGAYRGIITGPVDPLSPANVQNGAMDASLVQDPAPLGGRTETPEDILQMSVAHIQTTFNRLRSDAPKQAKTAVDDILVLNKVARSHMLYGQAAPKDETLIREMRTNLASDGFIETVKLARDKNPESVKAFGLTMADYTSNHANSYDSYEAWDNEIDTKYNSEPVLNGKPLSYFGTVTSDSLGRDGRVVIMMDEDEIRYEYSQANAQIGGSTDESVSTGARRRIDKVAEDRVVADIVARIREVEDQANLYTRNAAIREWTYGGAVGEPDFERAFTGGRGVGRGMYDALGVEGIKDTSNAQSN